MEQMTDIKSIMQDVRDTLRTIDAAYPAEEAKYLQAASRLDKMLGDTVSPSVSEFLAAMEQEFVCGLIYEGWLGFKLRYDCYFNSINSLFLKQDYEDILHERKLHALPVSQNALHTISAFCKQDAVSKDVGLEDISGYYAYLHTVGYKLAHYFGFRLADGLLFYLIPGYTGDSILSAQYAADLKNYLNVDIESL
ncbi:MAG: hypothetical protein ACI3W5_01185 [Faecousia sp.]